jgi:hypothetical protein
MLQVLNQQQQQGQRIQQLEEQYQQQGQQYHQLEEKLQEVSLVAGAAALPLVQQFLAKISQRVLNGEADENRGGPGTLNRIARNRDVHGVTAEQVSLHRCRKLAVARPSYAQ